MLSTQVRETVAVVTIHRQATLNSLTVGLADSLVDELERLGDADGVSAVVIAGAGRAFSSGGDLVDIAGDLGGNDARSRLRMVERLQRMVLAVRGCRLPTVAAVHGAVYGAGSSLALACDLLVAAADVRFCQVFLQRDLVPDLGATWLLQRAVGSHRARELLLLGDDLCARQALEWGLVNRVEATREQAVDTAVDLASRMGRADRAAVALTKQLVETAEVAGLAEVLRQERAAQALMLGSPVALQAVAAFNSPASAET